MVSYEENSVVPFIIAVTVSRSPARARKMLVTRTRSHSVFNE